MMQKVITVLFGKLLQTKVTPSSARINGPVGLFEKIINSVISQ
jgi:hypothetical protein